MYPDATLFIFSLNHSFIHLKLKATSFGESLDESAQEMFGKPVWKQ